MDQMDDYHVSETLSATVAHADTVVRSVKYIVAGAVSIAAIIRTGRARHAWIMAVPAAVDYISDRAYKRLDNEEV